MLYTVDFHHDLTQALKKNFNAATALTIISIRHKLRFHSFVTEKFTAIKLKQP